MRHKDEEILRLRSEARATEQGGEMREAIAFIKGAKWWEYHSTKGTMWQSDQALVAEEAERRYGYKPTHDDMARALLYRESSEPVLEEHDRWIDTDAIPPKPADGREPEEGDLVFWPMGDRGMVDFWDDDIEAECKRMGEYKPPIVLMRRAEVDARINEAR